MSSPYDQLLRDARSALVHITSALHDEPIASPSVRSARDALRTANGALTSLSVQLSNVDDEREFAEPARLLRAWLTDQFASDSNASAATGMLADIRGSVAAMLNHLREQGYKIERV